MYNLIFKFSGTMTIGINICGHIITMPSIAALMNLFSLIMQICVVRFKRLKAAVVTPYICNTGKVFGKVHNEVKGR